MKLLLVMALLGVGVNEVWADDFSTTIYYNTCKSKAGWTGNTVEKNADGEGWQNDKSALQLNPGSNTKSAFFPITSDMLLAPLAESMTSYKISFYFKPKAKFAFQMAVYSNKATVANNGYFLSDNYLAEVTVPTAGTSDEATVAYKINGNDVDGQTLTQEYYHFEVTVTSTTASFSLTTADGLTNKGSGSVTLDADETLGGIYFAGGDTRIDDITYSYQYSATATTTATITSMTGTGKTMYPVYALVSNYTDNSKEVASPTYTVSDGTKVTVSGSTITFTANCEKGLVVTESTTGSIINLYCYGPYEKTSDFSFVHSKREDIPLGITGGTQTLPRGFTHTTNIQRDQSGSCVGGAGSNTYPQYYNGIAITGESGGTIKMNFFLNYGLQIENKNLYFNLLSACKGQIVRVKYLPGSNIEPKPEIDDAVEVSSYSVVEEESNYTTTMYKDDYNVYTGYEAFTPVSKTAVPTSIERGSFGGQDNNAKLYDIILTKDNISEIATKIAANAASYNSIYLRPQVASDITTADLQSLVPTAYKNTWWFNLPNKNISSRQFSYWNYQKGINVRGYSGKSSWETFGYALTDGVDYTRSEAVTPSRNCTYDRVFTKDIVSTICLPFAIAEETAATLGKFYQLKNTTTTDNVVFEEVTATEALKPYLFVPAATGTITIPSGTTFVAAGDVTTQTEGGVTFNGSIASSPISSTIYGFASSGKLVTANSGTMNPFRAFLTTSTPGARLSLYSLEDETTGISGVNTEGETLHFYNLQGQAVKAPAKGLYIVNGKKVIIK